MLARGIGAVLGHDAAGDGGGEADGSGCGAWWEGYLALVDRFVSGGWGGFGWVDYG